MKLIKPISCLFDSKTQKRLCKIMELDVNQPAVFTLDGGRVIIEKNNQRVVLQIPGMPEEKMMRTLH